MSRLALFGFLLLTPAVALAQQQTGPQTLVPAPTRRPDTPGGAARQGVIRPPAQVDPGIARPPPAAHGTMPVIPPPGTPGGNPKVKPQ